MDPAGIGIAVHASNERWLPAMFLRQFRKLRSVAKVGEAQEQDATGRQMVAGCCKKPAMSRVAWVEEGAIEVGGRYFARVDRHKVRVPEYEVEASFGFEGIEHVALEKPHPIRHLMPLRVAPGIVDCCRANVESGHLRATAQRRKDGDVACPTADFAEAATTRVGEPLHIERSRLGEVGGINTGQQIPIKIKKAELAQFGDRLVPSK